MNLETCKNLGGIGAILIVLGTIASLRPILGILSIVGIVFVLIALKGLSDIYGDARIFNNTLYAIILLVIGLVSFVVTATLSALKALADLGIELSSMADVEALRAAIESHLSAGDWSTIWSFLAAILISLVVLFVFAVGSAFFFKRSMDTLAARSSVGMFGTAGLLTLIGALLTIIIVGFIIVWIAWILVAVAFFSIKAQTSTPAQSTKQVTSPLS